jgi:pimeloyl-ACP methyl ester carboxylesterase
MMSEHTHGGEQRGPTIVLVHGSLADASGFDALIQRLNERGYTTLAPSNPLRGLTSDAAYIRSVLEPSRDRSCSSPIPTAGWSPPPPRPATPR